MLGKQSGQIDIFNGMIFERLIPKDHLLVKIDETIDFSFVYEITKDYYSNIGRESIDPVVLFKLCLIEYLYCLSDREAVARTQTDIAFRWFLNLSLDDKVPDDTTISYFRSKRLGEKPFEEFFNAIVQKCIEKDLVKNKRYLIDSTDVSANANYPREKKLLCDAYRKLIRELNKFNPFLADEKLREFENDIKEQKKSEDISIKIYCKTARKYAEQIYVKTHNEFQDREPYYDAFIILWHIIEQYGGTGSSGDRIISCVDPDARVAHKRRGNQKRGYKDHIIVDEEREIILASEQTPFNVGDEKKLVDLIEKVELNFNLKPEEISADKVYGTIDIRSYLKDNNLTSNIGFYDNSGKEYAKFDISQFTINEDLKSAHCPNGCFTDDIKLLRNGTELVVTFSLDDCSKCPLRNKCFTDNDIKKGTKRRRLTLNPRYDAVVRDLKRINTDEYKEASNKRYIVERRFATMVRNHGLR